METEGFDFRHRSAANQLEKGFERHKPALVECVYQQVVAPLAYFGCGVAVLDIHTKSNTKTSHQFHAHIAAFAVSQSPTRRGWPSSL